MSLQFTECTQGTDSGVTQSLGVDRRRSSGSGIDGTVRQGWCTARRRTKEIPFVSLDPGPSSWVTSVSGSIIYFVLNPTCSGRYWGVKEMSLSSRHRRTSF